MLLDLSAAFDTVDHKILIDVLRRWFGIEGGAFLNTRSQVVRFGSGESDVVNTQFGVPQGSVLGPKRFLQHAEDVCPLMSRLQYHMFADDMQGLKQTVIITISYFVSNLPVIFSHPVLFLLLLLLLQVYCL